MNKSSRAYIAALCLTAMPFLYGYASDALGVAKFLLGASIGLCAGIAVRCILSVAAKR